MVRDGLVFKDEDGQVIFNQYSFCELVKRLLVELVGISYEEASQIVERSPLAEPVADAMGVAIFSHDLPYYWAMFFYYGNGYWQKGIPAQPEDMDAYEALENKIMEKYDLKEPFIWTCERCSPLTVAAFLTWPVFMTRWSRCSSVAWIGRSVGT